MLAVSYLILIYCVHLLSFLLVFCLILISFLQVYFLILFKFLFYSTYYMNRLSRLKLHLNLQSQLLILVFLLAVLFLIFQFPKFIFFIFHQLVFIFSPLPSSFFFLTFLFSKHALVIPIQVYNHNKLLTLYHIFSAMI